MLNSDPSAIQQIIFSGNFNRSGCKYDIQIAETISDFLILLKSSKSFKSNKIIAKT